MSDNDIFNRLQEAIIQGQVGDTETLVNEAIGSGMSPEEVVADFPDLTMEDIQACLAFAADRERSELVIAG